MLRPTQVGMMVDVVEAVTRTSPSVSQVDAQGVNKQTELGRQLTALWAWVASRRVWRVCSAVPLVKLIMDMMKVSEDA